MMMRCFSLSNAEIITSSKGFSIFHFPIFSLLSLLLCSHETLWQPERKRGNKLWVVWGVTSSKKKRKKQHFLPFPLFFSVPFWALNHHQQKQEQKSHNYQGGTEGKKERKEESLTKNNILLNFFWTPPWVDRQQGRGRTDLTCPHSDHKLRRQPALMDWLTISAGEFMRRPRPRPQETVKLKAQHCISTTLK